MFIYAVISTYYIEDYYLQRNITSLHETEEEAWDMVCSGMMERYYENFDEYMSSHAYSEARNFYEEEIQNFRAMRLDAQNNKPKYKGDSRDKEALARHYEVKNIYNTNIQNIYDKENLFHKDFVKPKAEEIKAEMVKQDLTADQHMTIMYWKSGADKIPDKVVKLETGRYIADQINY